MQSLISRHRKSCELGTRKVLTGVTVSMILLLFVGLGAGAKVFAYSPTGGEVLDNSTVNFTMEFTDPVETSYFCAPNDGSNLATPVEVQNGTKTNITASLPDGDYSYKIICNTDGDSNLDSNDENSSIKNFSVSTGGDGPGGDSGLAVGSYNYSDRTSYSPNISFIGEGRLRLLNGGGKNYTLEDSTGTLVDNASFFDRDGLFDLSGASTGRAKVYPHDNSSNNVSVDLVGNSNDVVGRYQSGNLKLYSWFEGSEISHSSNDDFNLTVGSWPGGKLFKLNFTEGQDYFIGLENSEGRFVKPSRGGSFKVATPRVNDFNMTGFSNITGNVTNSTGSAVQGLKLRLRRTSRETGGRFPFLTAPPVKYTFTNSSGGYNFTGLQPGSNYLVDIMNDSYTREPYSMIGEEGSGASVPGTRNGLGRNTEVTDDFTVTNETGNLSVKLIGEQAENVKYAFFISENTSYTTLKAGVTPGEYTNLSVPDGLYTVYAMKVRYTEGTSFPNIVNDFTSTQVNIGQESQIELGFPEQVKLEGVVKNSQGDPVSDVQVYAENRSERISRVGRSGPDGKFSVRVQNNTGYKLRAEPGFDSSYSKNTTNITVSGDTQENITVSLGPFIDGYIKDGDGNPVGGIEITAWNGTKRSYGENVSIRQGDKGYYRIGGLEKNTNYSVFVEPPEKYPFKQLEVNLSGDNTTKNISLGAGNDFKLSGTVQDTSNKDLNATVTLRSRDLGYENSSRVNGDYSFSGLDRGAYVVSVEPESSAYRDARQFTFINSDTSLDFKLKQFTGVSGKVTGPSGDVSGAYIYAYNYSEESFDSDRTDESGEYQLELSSVNHRVEIWPDEESDYLNEKTSLTASEISGGSKDFTLSTGYSLSGTVKDPGTKNFTGFISLYNGSENAYGYTEFSDGTYSISGLKNVSYSAYISVRDSEYSSKTKTVETSDIGKTRNFTFGSNKGPRLWVKVQDSSETRLANATVTADGVGKKTNARGIAKFERQPNKQKVAISATKPNYNSSSINPMLKNTTPTQGGGTTVVKIHNETLTIENVRGELVDVSINLTDSKGKNVSEASVVARAVENGSTLTSSEVTDSDGGTLEDILPGKKYLTSISANGDFGAENITFDSGEKNVTSIGKYNLGYEVPGS